MPAPGWIRLVNGWPWFRGEGTFPIAAYSEFMPAPFLVEKPYGGRDPHFFSDDDPWGWPITEQEETFHLRPGMQRVADQVIGAFLEFLAGKSDLGLGPAAFDGNPYWAPELAGRGPRPLAFLLSLALSLTMDEKGRARWTLFGGSELGPARGFWRGFLSSPGKESPPDQGLAFVRRLLQAVFNEPEERLANLSAAGFRILPQGDNELGSAEGPFCWTRRSFGTA